MFYINNSIIHILLWAIKMYIYIYCIGYLSNVEICIIHTLDFTYEIYMFIISYYNFIFND